MNLSHLRSARVAGPLTALATVLTLGCQPMPAGPPTASCNGIRAYTWCHPTRDGRPAYGTYRGAGVQIYGEILRGVACLYSNLGYGCVAEAHGVGGSYFEALGGGNDVLPIGYWYEPTPAGVATTTVNVWAL